MLAAPFEYIGTAQGVIDGEAFVWTHAKLSKLSASCSRLSENVLRIVLKRLVMYTNRHVGLLSNTAEQRLADTLIRMGRHFGRAVPGGAQLDIKNEHLASLADVNLFTASRLLKAWERSGAVKKGRGTVTILHPERLCIE
jgi:CRP-like cAMP-binding protein